MEINNNNVKIYEQKYEQFEQIGGGGFGKVYKAKVKEKDIYVAIKIIDKGRIKAALRNEHNKQDVEPEYNATFKKDFRKEIYYMRECQKNNNQNSVKLYVKPMKNL